MRIFRPAAFKPPPFRSPAPSLSHLFRFACALLLCGNGVTLWAQRSPARATVALEEPTQSPVSSLSPSPLDNHFSSAGVKVALLDLGQVFRQLDRFRQRVAQVKTDVETFEQDLVSAEAQLAKQRAQLVKHKRPSAKDRAEEELTKAVAEVQLQRELKRQAMLKAEAKLYFEAYIDVKREVEAFCKQHQIDLVIRFDRSAVNPHDRDAVLARCNRTLVYQRGLDITDIVVERLNGKTHWASRPYGAPTIRGKIRKNSQWMTTIPIIAVQQVITARTAWAVDQMVFPDGS